MSQTVNDITANSLEELVERITEAREYNFTLSAEDNQLILDALSTLSILQEKMADKDITLHKLKKLLGMIKSSEKHKSKKTETEAQENRDAEDAANQEVNAKNRADKKRARNSKKKAPKPKIKPLVVHHALTDIKKGDSCRSCQRGKFNKIEPASLLRITGNSPFVPMHHLSEKVRCNTCGLFVTAELPASVKADGGSDQKYGFSARSLMAINKYFAGNPFFRQSSVQELLGVSITASTIFDQCEYLGNDLFPVFELMLKVAADAQGYQIDDTTNRILDQKPIEKKRRNSDKMRMRSGIYTSGMIANLTGDDNVILYKTNIGHSGEFIDEILENRSPGLIPPTIMCDALSSNRPSVISDFNMSNCNAHGRRGFIDVLSSFPKEVDYVLKLYKNIWINEDIVNEKTLTKSERLLYHREHSLPVMEKILAWCNDYLTGEDAEENGGLGRAARYFVKHYKGLAAFCHIEGALLDNNKMEGQLKLIARGRKNAYFFKTLAGASIADVITSLIATAHHSGTNVFTYFNDVQRNSEKVRANPEQWLPWNYKGV